MYIGKSIKKKLINTKPIVVPTKTNTVDINLKIKVNEYMNLIRNLVGTITNQLKEKKYGYWNINK